MGAHKKVLIADDDAFVRELVRVKLRVSGIEVVEASDGQEALEVIRRERPDLIILDLMMPKMSGQEVFEHLKADPLMARTPVIILTARGDPQPRELGDQHGVAAYITKPFSPRELAERIQALLGESA